MEEDRTILFTITEEDCKSATTYWIRSETPLGFNLSYNGTEYFRGVTESLLFDALYYISSELNVRGYSAVFAID